jgi:hypothetical protein
LLKDQRSGAPVPGVTVRHCDFLDDSVNSPCSKYLATATTDADGWASLPFQKIPAVGGQQGLGVNGFLMATSPSIRTLFYSWGFPLSQPAMYSYGEVTTPDEFQTESAAVYVTSDPNRGKVTMAVYTCPALNTNSGGVAGAFRGV